MLAARRAFALPAAPFRRVRVCRAVLLAWGVALWLLARPAAAEPRSVLGVHVAGLDVSGMGVELEQERADSTAWLAGLSLEPAGLYAGARRYTRPRGDRPFYGAYLSLAGRRSGYELGLWFSGGYEVRFDARVRGTGEVGFGLTSSRGGPDSALFIALSLGWKL